MKKPYALLIDFCEAEVASSTKDFVSVELRGDHYNVVFLPLSHSCQILRPEFLDMQNARDARLFGDQYEPYEDDTIFLGIAHMLGLISPWTPCLERLPEAEEDYLVLSNGKIKQASFMPKGMISEVAPGGWVGNSILKENYWVVNGWEISASHWQPLPPSPLHE